MLLSVPTHMLIALAILAVIVGAIILVSMVVIGARTAKQQPGPNTTDPGDETDINS
jgi:hypothetical protein